MGAAPPGRGGPHRPRDPRPARRRVGGRTKGVGTRRPRSDHMPARAQVTFDGPVDVLNYALTLEHLEAAFYRDGLNGFTEADFANAGSRSPGGPLSDVTACTASPGPTSSTPASIRSSSSTSAASEMTRPPTSRR